MFSKLIGEQVSVKGLDGKIYTLSQLTVEEFAKFTTWVQYKPYRDAVEADFLKEDIEKIKVECQKGKVIEKVLPDDWPKDKEATDQDLIEKEFPLTFTSTVVQNEMFNYEALCKVILLSMEIKHPEIKGKKIAELFDNEQIAEMHKVIWNLNALENDVDTPEAEENPT